MAPKKEVALSKMDWTAPVHLVLAARKPRNASAWSDHVFAPAWKTRLLLSQNFKLCPQYMSYQKVNYDNVMK